MDLNQDTVYGAFKAQALDTPNHPAIITDKKLLSYEVLLDLVDRISASLPDSLRCAGIVTDHGPFMIASMLAVLKKGASYVPVEPDFPKKRIEYMLRDSGAELVITNDKYKGRFTLPVFGPYDVKPGPANADNASKPDDPAYHLYTSGTTGKPKGVTVLNRNILHYVRAFDHEFHPSYPDVMLQYSVCSFDIFVEEVFTTLLSGAALAIPDKKTKDDSDALMDFADRHHVTIISGFPYLLQDMNTLDSIPKSLRLLISGGDVLREDYITNLQDKVRIYNTYGPSETTVCASYFPVNGYPALKDGTYPIGKPVKGTEIDIVDENLSPLPDGETGELLIYGGGVSAGYGPSHQKENEAFVSTEKGPAYKSGDLGYRLDDGNIAFLHRKDQQIMVMGGKRVEPEEVLNDLYLIPEVRQAAVTSARDTKNLDHLIAYVVLHEGGDLESVREKLSEYLPSYMIPEYFSEVEELPLNVNGKIDYSKLPLPEDRTWRS